MTHTCDPPEIRPDGRLWRCEDCGHIWQASVAVGGWQGLTRNGADVLEWFLRQTDDERFDDILGSRE